MKIKRNNKRDKYLNLARKLDKLRNMKMMAIPVVIGALEAILKGLERGLEESEIEGRAETLQSMALLRSARMLRRVLETFRDLLSLKLQ